MMLKIDGLKQRSQELRVKVLNMNYMAGSGHKGGSFSCAEILTVLYYDVLRIRPTEPGWDNRDRFILSKGHAAPALYATLARKGYFSEQLLEDLRKFGSPLQGHPCMFKLAGIDMSTGSLGMGISVGVGMALAGKQQNKDYRVFVLCGDGELQEGSNWEGSMSASKWGLDNLMVIVDRNGVQLDSINAEIMPLGDLKLKIESFGIRTERCDGHDVDSLLNAFHKLLDINCPTALIADTVKGKGVSFIEGKHIWHGKQIMEEEYKKAMTELVKELK